MGVFWASRLGIRPQGRDLDFKAGIWASKLGFVRSHRSLRSLYSAPLLFAHSACLLRSWAKLIHITYSLVGRLKFLNMCSCYKRVQREHTCSVGTNALFVVTRNTPWDRWSDGAMEGWMGRQTDYYDDTWTYRTRIVIHENHALFSLICIMQSSHKLVIGSLQKRICACNFTCTTITHFYERRRNN